MIRMMLLPLLALGALAGGAEAQAHGTHSPHAPKESRETKALSAEEVEGYRSGRGMGLALAAELNHYPGPRHALDLASELALSSEQAAALRAIYEEMNRRAVPLGREYVEREHELDRLFATGAVTEPRLRELTAETGRLLGELRHVHLRAHLETRALLTEEQVRRYDVARGYGR